MLYRVIITFASQRTLFGKMLPKTSKAWMYFIGTADSKSNMLNHPNYKSNSETSNLLDTQKQLAITDYMYVDSSWSQHVSGAGKRKHNESHGKNCNDN